MYHTKKRSTPSEQRFRVWLASSNIGSTDRVEIVDAREEAGAEALPLHRGGRLLGHDLGLARVDQHDLALARGRDDDRALGSGTTRRLEVEALGRLGAGGQAVGGDHVGHHGLRRRRIGVVDVVDHLRLDLQPVDAVEIVLRAADEVHLHPSGRDRLVELRIPVGRTVPALGLRRRARTELELNGREGHGPVTLAVAPLESLTDLHRDHDLPGLLDDIDATALDPPRDRGRDISRILEVGDGDLGRSREALALGPDDLEHPGTLERRLAASISALPTSQVEGDVRGGGLVVPARPDNLEVGGLGRGSVGGDDAGLGLRHGQVRRPFELALRRRRAVILEERVVSGGLGGLNSARRDLVGPLRCEGHEGDGPAKREHGNVVVLDGILEPPLHEVLQAVRAHALSGGDDDVRGLERRDLARQTDQGDLATLIADRGHRLDRDLLTNQMLELRLEDGLDGSEGEDDLLPEANRLSRLPQEVPLGVVRENDGDVALDRLVVAHSRTVSAFVDAAFTLFVGLRVCAVPIGFPRLCLG